MQKFFNKLHDYLNFITNGNTTAGYISLIAFFAVFCHFRVTVALMYALAIFIAVCPATQKQIIKHKSAYILFLFFIVTLITAYVHRNLRGISMSWSFLMISIIGLYLRSVMTEKLFEFLLNLFCLGCIPIFIGCIISKIMYFNEVNYRIGIWFGNSNYLSSILAAIIIICAYKVIGKKGASPAYYLVALGCAICIYFSGSMFAWIEIFAGVSTLLSIKRKHQLLGGFLLFCVLGFFILYCVPEVFPRLNESNITTDNRVLIWQDSIHYIPENLWFGKGFFTYRTLPMSYPTSHAHNFVIEPLLSFGIIGSLILAAFFFFYYRSVIICGRLLRRDWPTAIILSISAAVIIHATTDMTMIWSQTALFYAMVMSGLGASEAKLEKIRLRRKLNSKTI